MEDEGSALDRLVRSLRMDRSVGDQTVVRLIGDNFGHWVGVRRTPAGRLGEIGENLYYSRGPLTSGERAALRQLGWSGRHPRDPQRTWPGRTPLRRIAADVLAVVTEVFGASPGDLQIDAGPAVPDGLSAFPHAILFWDARDNVPFEDLAEAANRVFAAGATEIFFNEAAADTDYVVVVAGRPVDMDEANRLWHHSNTEMPNCGGWLVARGC